MKTFLTITGLIEGTTGLALAIMPSLFVSILLGTTMADSSAILIGRLAGAALITIGIACWLSRTQMHSFIMVKAMMVYNILSITLLIYTVLFENISGPGLWPAIMVHVVLLVWCAVVVNRQSSIVNNEA